MNKKVGLVLAFKGTNYGALLQAYATQYIVESLGFDTEIIDYKRTNKYENVYVSLGYVMHYLRTKCNRGKIQKNVNSQCINKSFVSNQIERKQVSIDFLKRRMHNIRVIAGRSELKQAVQDYKAVIVGSDQKWTPGVCYNLIDSLRFVPSSVRRISYATSLGVASYPKYCWKDSMKMWKRIDYLSVREQQGANIIKQICGDIDVSVVLDPTYLLTKEQWEMLVPVQQMTSSKYALCYFLGNDIESKKWAKRYCNLHGLHLVSILSVESFSDIDYSYADEVISGIAPESFINWVRGAEIILTDSFHGLAFSIINEKQFYVFYRKRDDALQSRNSRIDNILKTWNIEERLIKDKNEDWNDKLEVSIDYSIVNKLLDEKREKSLYFLKKALNFDEDN